MVVASLPGAMRHWWVCSSRAARLASHTSVGVSSTIG